MNDMLNPRRRGDRILQRSEGEESENPFFEGDGSSLLVKREEWEDGGVADDDYEEGPVFDDDPYEEEIVSGDIGVNLVFESTIVGRLFMNLPDYRYSFESKIVGRLFLVSIGINRFNDGVADDDYKEGLVFDDDPYEEELVSGDVGSDPGKETVITAESKHVVPGDWNPLRPSRKYFKEHNTKRINSRHIKKEKEERIGKCIRQITRDCKNMLRKKIDEIKVYNSTISQNKYKQYNCFYCNQKGHILKSCLAKIKDEVEHAQGHHVEIAEGNIKVNNTGGLLSDSADFQKL
nr:ARID DNA-binding domain-containing protein [Tanacetum cinerariifolium]